jgi:hypothetical protein
MASSFTWLDYSEKERQRILDILTILREHETRDELGIGVVRDAFSDMFFPGTSTIQTRAKYFLFVPWMYKRLEEKKVPSSKIDRSAREEEVRLIYALLKSDDTDGVIGKDAKKNLSACQAVSTGRAEVLGYQTLSQLHIQLPPQHRCIL